LFKGTVVMIPKRTSHAIPLILTFLAALISSALWSKLAAARLQSGQTNPSVVEHGEFLLHKFEQRIGEETYEIERDGNSVTVQMDFKFTDRGTDVPLSATFRAAPDLTPEAFEIKGQTSRNSKIDEAVEVQQGKTRLRDHDAWTETIPPKQFFTIAGYAPATMQMLMVRFWAAHGSPAQLPTLPRGDVKIERRGQDTIPVNGMSETLDRYTVEGLVWGRETLWFDASRNLIAEISVDAEFDHFEAIREAEESALASLSSMRKLASLRWKLFRPRP
jgi:hypothetical protein